MMSSSFQSSVMRNAVVAMSLFALIAFAQSCSNPPNQLQIADLPILDTVNSGFKNNGVLTLVLYGRLVDNRLDANITLNPNQSVCNYPGPNWNRTVVGCNEIWTGTLAWSTASSLCGLTRSETNDLIIYDGSIDVQQKDVLGAIRGTPITREIISAFDYSVRFPKAIALEATIQVFAPILVDAAITAQRYEPQSQEGKINLFTSVQWPFDLVNPQISVNVAQLTPAIGSASNNCPSNAPCEENYNVSVARNNLCFFSGQYTTQYNIVCNPLFTGECPLQGENATVVFDVVSVDLCGLFVENIDLQGSLRSYLADYQTTRAAFIIGQVSYWRVDVSSTKAVIVDTRLLNVSAQFGSNPEQFLMSSSLSTALGGEVGFQLDGNGSLATQARFRFNVAPAIFPIAVDANAPATVRALVAVSYQNTQNRKRSTLKELFLDPAVASKRQIAPASESKSQPFDSSAIVEIQNPALSTPTQEATAAPSTSASSQPSGQPSNQPNTQAATAAVPTGDVESKGGDSPVVPIVISLFAVLIVCCLAIGLVVVMRRRRQQKEQQQQSSSSSQAESGVMTPPRMDSQTQLL